MTRVERTRVTPTRVEVRAVEPLTVTLDVARELLGGMSEGTLRKYPDLPIVDLAPPGSRKPMPRVRLTDLRAFVARRAGDESPSGDGNS